MILLIQASNFHHRRGGLWEVIALGKADDLARRQERERGLDFFLLGGIFIMRFTTWGFSWPGGNSGRRSTSHFLLPGRPEAIHHGRTLPGADDAGARLGAAGEDRNTCLSIWRSLFSDVHPVAVHGLFPAAAPADPVSRRRLFVAGRSDARSGFFLQPAAVRIDHPRSDGVHLPGNAVAIRRQQSGALVFVGGTLLLCLAAINDILYVERVLNTGFSAPIGLFLTRRRINGC